MTANQLKLHDRFIEEMDGHEVQVVTNPESDGEYVKFIGSLEDGTGREFMLKADQEMIPAEVVA